MIGRIKRLVLDKGFGFIAVDGDRDVFFHCTSLVDVVWNEKLANLEVSFSVRQCDRGIQAFDVTPCN